MRWFKPKVVVHILLCVIASVIVGASDTAVANPGSDLQVATATSSTGELDTAVALFARFHPELLAPNKRIKIGDRWIAPAFTPLRPGDQGPPNELITRIAGALVSGEMSELNMFLPTPTTETTTFSLPSRQVGSDPYDTERPLNSVALVEGGVKAQTDVLVRPIPLGFSVYVQFRSPRAPEQLKIEDKVMCAPLGSELIQRLRPGTFSVDEPIREGEYECEPYSRSPTPSADPISPSDTFDEYQHELRLLRSANKRARSDHAHLVVVLSATSARDAAGHLVPTEIAWRYDDEPVVRVRHRNHRYRYPLLLHIEIITTAQ